MIGGVARIFDNLLGRGEAAVTVPPLDGAFRPNRRLDEATSRTALEHVDCLAVHGDALLASTGDSIFVRGGDADWSKRKSYRSEIACIAAVGADGLAVAFETGEILIEGGRFDGRRYPADASATCITAIVASGRHLYVANGSSTNRPAAWQRDLLERNASGTIWRIDLESGAATKLADGLAWPAGLAVDGDSLVFSEAWKHQLVRINPSHPENRQVFYADLPAYPGRITPASDGYWLALFAPRSQLVEFVLREPAYRKRMIAEVPQPFWVAPNLRSGRNFYESLQGGGVKHLGMLKPWAPTMSAGFCVKLDRSFQPRSSLQSRADGHTHGITSVIEHQGQIFAASRGDGVIVSLPATDPAAGSGGEA
jgi:hypothetical protein